MLGGHSTGYLQKDFAVRVGKRNDAVRIFRQWRHKRGVFMDNSPGHMDHYRDINNIYTN